MRTTKFKLGLMSAVAVLGLGVFSSCSKDFQGDIDGINDRISKLEGLSKEVADIKKAVDEGKVITSVEKTDDGIVIVVGGNTYKITNGKDGAAGEAGKPGSVVTIGDNGNWVIDNKDTGKPSRGEQGETGEPGAPGKAGKYYVPGTEGDEAGFWVEVDPNVVDDNGVAKRTITEEKWLPEGTITAEYVNGVLTLFNVKGGEGELKKVVINPALSSLEVLPDMVYIEDEPLVVFRSFTAEPCACDFSAVSVEEIKMIVNEGATEEDVKDVELLYNSPVRVKKDVRSAAIKPEVVEYEITDYPHLQGVKLLTVKFKINPIYTNRILNDNGEIELQKGASNQVDHIYVAAKNRFGAWVVSNPIEVVSRKVNVNNLELVSNYNNTKFPRTEAEAEKILDDLAKKLGGSTEGKTDFNQADAPEVVKVPYNEKFDLEEFVHHELEGKISAEELKGYNIDITYDLLNEEGKKIVYTTDDRNKTPQQEFITHLGGSEFQAKVYELDPNRQTIGRTPIVHVRYTFCTKDATPGKSGQDVCEDDNCPIDVETEGTDAVLCRGDFFIPLFYVEEVKAPEPDVTLTLDRGKFGKVDYCVDYTHELTTKEMITLIYHKLNVPYSEFIADYKLQNDSAEKGKEFNKGTEYVGWFTEVKDPGDTNNTNRLVWHISAEELYDYRGDVVKGLAVYSNGSNRVTVEFTAQLPTVTFNANALKMPYAWKENSVLLNAETPNEKSKAGVVTYTSYLENAFNNKVYSEGAELDREVVKEKSGLTKFRYWFGFAKDQKTLSKGNVTYKLIPVEYVAGSEDAQVADEQLEYSPKSDDGVRDGENSGESFMKTYAAADCPECAGAHRRHYTMLFAEKFVDGKVVKVDGKTRHLVLGLSGENNSFYEVNKNDEVALEILNLDAQFLKATLQLFVMDDCGHCITVTGLGEDGKFDATFQRPLVLTAGTGSFINGVNRGSTGAEVDLSNKFEIHDWRLNSSNPTTRANSPFKTHPWYYNYYNVIVVDYPEGEAIRDMITLKNFKDAEGKEVTEPLGSMNFFYNKPTGDKKLGVLEYWNNDNTIMTNFSIVLPVTITYEYGTITVDMEIPVENTNIE